eukprot:TRINITY_DN11313_c0_g1_i1.p1 TRINITY_DN11313_c0_g1~~TRINITY_DN11313_c0_g1_i1.p1  ORF type:complete len:216 (-),score=42.39 TRINITY_DN11313_c0_g1_i1:16-663(-)
MSTVEEDLFPDDLLDEELTDYGNKEYWDHKYLEERIFDWYQDYFSLKDLLNNLIPKTKRVLVVGCGNSKLSEDMVNDGYESVINVDVAHIVVKQMQKRSKEQKLENKLSFMTMDVRALAFRTAAIDIVVDKGTLDALACSENYSNNIAMMCSEISRTLVKGGVFLVITYGDPASRLEYFQNPKYEWKVEYQEVAKKPEVEGEIPSKHWVYIITKQ